MTVTLTSGVGSGKEFPSGSDVGLTDSILSLVGDISVDEQADKIATTNKQIVKNRFFTFYVFTSQ